MSEASTSPKTPGATRAGSGPHVFDLSTINHIQGGPDYSSANGSCVEGERIMIALMHMPAGTGAEPHSHPNEQWMYVIAGTYKAVVCGEEYTVPAGWALYVPSNAVHSGHATPDADVVFFTCKDTSFILQGIRAA